MLFNFSIQTKHFITKKSKFFKKMNCFIKILYPNTLQSQLVQGSMACWIDEEELLWCVMY